MRRIRDIVFFWISHLLIFVTLHILLFYGFEDFIKGFPLLFLSVFLWTIPILIGFLIFEYIEEKKKIKIGLKWYLLSGTLLFAAILYFFKYLSEGDPKNIYPIYKEPIAYNVCLYALAIIGAYGLLSLLKKRIK